MFFGRKVLPVLFISFGFLCCSTPSLAAKCFQDFSTSNFTNCELLSEKFALHWSIIGEDIKLGFQVDQNTTAKSSSFSWFAFGVSESGGMRGTDIVAILKNDAGVWEASDRFSREYEMPQADSHQDWTLVQPPQIGASGTSVIAVVSRKLKTCDVDDLEIVRGYAHAIVWAIGTSETFGYHGPNRGNARLVFGESEKQKAQAASLQGLDRSSYRNLTLLMPNITMSTNETSYQCFNFETPADNKYHVVEYSPKIDNRFIHHIVIYQCQSKPKDMTKVYECMSMSTNCATIAFVWAPGIKLITYPAEAGFSIGNGPGAMKYGAVQVHYNNPEHVSGVVDSSGLVLTYTPVLRKYDVGILTLGSLGIRVPPNQANGRDNIRRGASSSQEMCFNFISYYPRLFEYPEICMNSRSGDICSSWKNFLAMGNPDVYKYMLDTGELRTAQKIPSYTPLPNSTCPAASDQFYVSIPSSGLLGAKISPLIWAIIAIYGVMVI
ncbi:hypothetical protein HK098_001829 [Nowakowskiella sp. JEL0407]|nr:hypothetical protein HK098_001829 [Nowakowskiella sp. JEL0407]